MKKKKKKLEVGSRVVWLNHSNLETYNEYEDDTTRGTVESINEHGDLFVKWDDSWWNAEPKAIQPEDVISEEEADKILSKLEKEYEVWAAPIRKKMESAAKLLREAGELADKQDKNLSEMHEIVGPLISAMDQIGWRTSSLSC